MATTETKEVRVWDFVEKYYPKYYNQDLIAYSDDLQKIIDKEEEEGSDAAEILKNIFRGMREPVVIEQNRIIREIYEEAIENFLTQQI
jgi:hypothetical protein